MFDNANLKELGKLGAAAPAQRQAFQAWEEAVMADGALSRKHKELIAVAVALATQCPYCIDIHANAARKEGASEAELAEAAFVAAATKSGGAIIHAALFV